MLVKRDGVENSKEENIKQKVKRKYEEENPTDTVTKKQKKKRRNSNEQLCDKEQSESKKHKKKKRNNSEELDHKEQSESFDNSESKMGKKHKQGKKKKKVKEITDLDGSQEKAISYLNKWQYDRQNWKFEKVRQVWLLKHMLKDGKVPDSVFPILVEYLSGAKGHARQVALEKTMEVVRVMEQCAELSEQGMNEEEIVKQCPNRVSEKIYDRARTILQCLQENE